MADTKRWTVRGIQKETLEMLSVVRQHSTGNYGDYVNEAVAQWYESLPDADEDNEEDA